MIGILASRKLSVTIRAFGRRKEVSLVDWIRWDLRETIAES